MRSRAGIVASGTAPYRSGMAQARRSEKRPRRDRAGIGNRPATREEREQAELPLRGTANDPRGTGTRRPRARERTR